jgi:hypothetical protein
VAVDANSGHRLVAAAVQVGSQKPRAGDWIKGVELGKARAAVRSRAELDGIGADMSAGIAHKRRIHVQAVPLAVSEPPLERPVTTVMLEVGPPPRVIGIVVAVLYAAAAGLADDAVGSAGGVTDT